MSWLPGDHRLPAKDLPGAFPEGDAEDAPLIDGDLVGYLPAAAGEGDARVFAQDQGSPDRLRFAAGGVVVLTALGEGLGTGHVTAGGGEAQDGEVDQKRHQQHRHQRTSAPAIPKNLVAI